MTEHDPVVRSPAFRRITPHRPKAGLRTCCPPAQPGHGVIATVCEFGSKLPVVVSLLSLYISASAPLATKLLPPPLPVTVVASKRGTPLPVVTLTTMVLKGSAVVDQ